MRQLGALGMAEHPPPLLRIGYRMERADYIALCRALQTKPIQRALIEIAVYFVLLLAGAFVAANFNVATFLRVLGDFASFEAPWWFYLLLILGPVLALSHTEWVALVAALTYRRNAIADKNVSLSFDGSGVTATATNYETKVGWDAFIRLVETPTHAFLAISRREALIVPRRAFADEHDHRTLLAFIRARLAANVMSHKGKTAA